MLAQAIERGYVEKIPVMKPQHWVSDEEWYRDKRIGKIYSSVPPEEKYRGQWIRVDPGDQWNPGETVH